MKHDQQQPNIQVPRAAHHLAWFLPPPPPSPFYPFPKQIRSVIIISANCLAQERVPGQEDAGVPSSFAKPGVGDGEAAQLHPPLGWSVGRQASRAAGVHI